MKFVTVRDFRERPAEVWAKLKDTDLVVTSNGRPIALLTPVNEDSIMQEMENLRRARAMAALTRMQGQVQKCERMSEAEAAALIQSVRQQ